MGVTDFRIQMQDKGWWIFPDVISPDLVSRMIVDLEASYVRCRELQIAAGLVETEGTCHHLIGQADSFMECLSEYEKLDEYFTEYFRGRYILNSFGGNILKKGMSYANEIHRDIRSFSGGLPLMMNTLIFLDDFTIYNGATWLMEAGHLHKDKPSESEFMNYAFQITGKAGSIAVWNSNLWHRAGVNTTDTPRRSVTPELTRPFMKQGFDYTKFADDEQYPAMTPWMQQILGWYSRIPDILEDWYLKPNERFYRSDQG